MDSKEYRVVVDGDEGCNFPEPDTIINWIDERIHWVAGNWRIEAEVLGPSQIVVDINDPRVSVDGNGVITFDPSAPVAA